MEPKSDLNQIKFSIIEPIKKDTPYVKFNTWSVLNIIY